MPSRKIKVKGVTVRLWKQSFKVEGMSGVIFLKRDIQEHEVIELVEAIYANSLKTAEETAIRKVVDQGAKLIGRMLCQP